VASLPNVCLGSTFPFVRRGADIIVDPQPPAGLSLLVL
jgi:hypothetical protein